jgi:hypothetical protein
VAVVARGVISRMQATRAEPLRRGKGSEAKRRKICRWREIVGEIKLVIPSEKEEIAEDGKEEWVVGQ